VKNHYRVKLFVFYFFYFIHFVLGIVFLVYYTGLSPNYCINVENIFYSLFLISLFLLFSFSILFAKAIQFIVYLKKFIKNDYSTLNTTDDDNENIKLITVSKKSNGLFSFITLSSKRKGFV
jgi:hypothetical protein